MKIRFKKYDSNSRVNHPDVGDVCLCECPEFCEEGVIPATYGEEGFVFSNYGNISHYVIGYVIIDP